MDCLSHLLSHQASKTPETEKQSYQLTKPRTNGIMKIQIAVILAALLQVTYGAWTRPRIVKIEASNPERLMATRGACPKRIHSTLHQTKRGDILRVDTMKNNRYGGFMRLSLVPERDMYKKKVHERLSFFFSCADSRPIKCNYKTKQLCLHDRSWEHFRHYSSVPEVYPDGVYILGIARYGSYTKLARAAKNIGTGDYFECVRIRIKGGPLKYYHKPIFTSDQSVTGGNGYCRSTVTNLRCQNRFCAEKSAPLVRPDEFRKKIKPIVQKNFRNRVSLY